MYSFYEEKGPKSLPLLPTTWEAIGQISVLETCLHTVSGNLGRGQKILAVMTINIVRKYSVLGFSLFFFF